MGRWGRDGYFPTLKAMLHLIVCLNVANDLANLGTPGSGHVVNETKRFVEKNLLTQTL